MKEHGGQSICAVAENRNRNILKSIQSLAVDLGIEISHGPKTRKFKSFNEIEHQKHKPLEIRAKKNLPHTLLLRYDICAFVGLTHDSLAKVFEKALAEEP